MVVRPDAVKPRGEWNAIDRFRPSQEMHRFFRLRGREVRGGMAARDSGRRCRVMRRFRGKNRVAASLGFRARVFFNDLLCREGGCSRYSVRSCGPLRRT